jgi:DNA repair photolyase
MSSASGAKRPLFVPTERDERSAAGPGTIPPRPFHKGRGASSNTTGRHERERRVTEDDGWGIHDFVAAPKTEVTLERARTIITRNDSPDISFDRSINPYRGCEHGCVYCYARPSHANMGLSPGLDFETRLFAKPNAAALLEKELSAPRYSVKTIAIGTNTDPYQPIERTQTITRQILEVLAKADHPVAIVTKSALVLRDLDILAPMAAKGLVKVALSITTLDADLARRLEPRASAPERRLHAIEELAKAGVPASVMVAPIIPAINDAEIETILTRAASRGAREAGYVMLRLPLELQDLFEEWLGVHFPDKLRHVMTLVRSMRKDKAYDAAWGERMTGTGPFAWMIGRRFEAAAARNGFASERLKLRTDLFRRPVAVGEQLSLL